MFSLVTPSDAEAQQAPKSGAWEEGDGLGPPSATGHLELAAVSLGAAFSHPGHNVGQSVPIPDLCPLALSILLLVRCSVTIFGSQRMSLC